MRLKARTDSNHAEIVTALRAVGCFVQSLASIGKGAPDLLVIHRGAVHVLEVKDGAKPASGRKLTKDEAKWHAGAFAYGRYAVPVVTSIEDALKVIGAAK